VFQYLPYRTVSCVLTHHRENLWDVINSNRTVASTKENIAATVFRRLQQVS